MVSGAHIRGRWWLGFLVVLALAVFPTGGATAKDGSEAIQFGLASWYGPGFHGGETASGEIFDERQMVAAHRTLPFGAVVRVTNLENGRGVTLRVIDRGPYGRNYRKGTVIDVSRGAAGRLGFIKKGIVRVRIDVIRFPD